MRDLPPNWYSWSKLSPYMRQVYNININEVPKEIIKYGLEMHKLIQSKLTGFSEFTPLIVYKDKILLGHIDMIDFDQKKIYEIKSLNYYNNYGKLAEAQLAYYNYVTTRFMEKHLGQNVEYTAHLLLYRSGEIVTEKEITREVLLERQYEVLQTIEAINPFMVIK